MAIDLPMLPSERKKSDAEILNNMLTQLQELNVIAMLKEEEFVIRNIIHGKSRQWIIDKLKEKYPNNTKISRKTLDDFLLLYRDILDNEMVNIEKGYVRRLIKSQEGLNNQLIDLAQKAHVMCDRYDAEGDNTNAINALKASADIFMKVGKIAGIAKDQPDVTVNMQLDKIVTEINTSDSEFKKSVLNVLNQPDETVSVDAEFKVKE